MKGVVVLFFAAGIAGGITDHIKADKERERAADAELVMLREKVDAQTAQQARTANRLDRLKKLINKENSVTNDELSGKYLGRVEDLPAYGQRVTNDIAAIAANATVEIGVRRRHGNGKIVPHCTATKVQDDKGNVYVSSAAHCFADPKAKASDPPGPHALNVTESQPVTYHILNPLEPLERRLRMPLATVSQVAVDRSGNNDIAILKANATDYAGAYARWDNIPAVPLGQFTAITGGPKPIAGAEVAIFSVPAANNFSRMQARGVYLGRIVLAEDAPSKVVDVVGINPGSPDEDVCNFGASGSSAIVSNTVVLGPLVERQNIGYGPNAIFQGDHDHPKVSLSSRVARESQLGIDTSQYATLCGFTAVQDPADIGLLIQAAENPNFVAK
jgi:hypothetical protein